MDQPLPGGTVVQTGKDTDRMTFTIRSDPQELPRVREAVRSLCRRVGFGEEDTCRVVLAMDEALANVIKHAYTGRCDLPVALRLELVEEAGHRGVRFRVRDFGPRVKPESIVGRPLDDVRPGGLGVHIIRSVMDRVTYEPADGGGMQLELVKLTGS